MKIFVIIIIVILTVSVGSYILWVYKTGNSPFCSPSGNGFLPCTYSATFTISINYTGSWQAQYYGYHGTPQGAFSSNGSITGGTFSGTSAKNKAIELSAPDNQQLVICVLAMQLAKSNSNLTISILEGDLLVSNSTGIPFGSTYVCSGVVP